MEGQSYTRKYLYNNELTNADAIPPDADFLCVLLDDNDQQLLIEHYEAGKLAGLIGQAQPGELANQTAFRITELAEEGCLKDRTSAISVKIQIDSAEFAQSVTVEDGLVVTALELFEFFPGTEWFRQIESELAGQYYLEVTAVEPIPLLFQRMWLDSDKCLLSIEYPLYELDNSGIVREAFAFTELSEKGETILLNNVASNSDEATDSSSYVYPAGKDDHLNSASQYFQSQWVNYSDRNWEPVKVEELGEHQEIFVSFGEGEKTLKMIEHLQMGGLDSVEIFEVPPEQHYFVLHAYIRQFHRDMRLVSSNADDAHIVRINSPVMYDSTANIELEPGQSRQHASIFHFSGQLVAHQCTIFDSKGTPVENFWLKSPLDDGANLDEDNPYAYGNPMCF